MKRALLFLTFVFGLLLGSHKAEAQIGPFCNGANSSLVTYRNEVPYVTGNVVIYYGVIYQATQNSTGQHPCTNGGTNSAYWTQVLNASASAPTGPAAGVLAGTYPNPGFAPSPSFSGLLSNNNAGTFSSGQANLNSESLVGGINPSTEYYAVQFTYGTEGLTGGLACPSGATTHQCSGTTGYATSLSTAAEAVGVYGQGRALANGVHVFGMNAVAQDVFGLTGVIPVGIEADTQALNAPGSYSTGVGVSAFLYNPGGQLGTFPFNGFLCASGTSGAYWNHCFQVNQGALSSSGAAFYLQSTGTANSGSGNLGSPIMFRTFLSLWSGSAAVSGDYDMQAQVPAGSPPAYDLFKVFVNGGAAAHYFEIGSTINLALQRSDTTFEYFVTSGSGSNAAITLPSVTSTLASFSSATSPHLPYWNGSSYTDSSLYDTGTAVETPEQLILNNTGLLGEFGTGLISQDAYFEYQGTRTFMGYAGTDVLTTPGFILQGGASKAVYQASGSNTWGSGTGWTTLDANGFGVGSSSVGSTAQPWYVDIAGIEHLSSIYSRQGVAFADIALSVSNSTSTTISRNNADAQAAFTVSNSDASSTGGALITSNAGTGDQADFGSGAKIDNAGNLTSLTLKAASARKGTFVCTGAGTISVVNANVSATSDVIITMNTAGGTISTPPAMKTTTPTTGFSVLCGAADASTYNYDIIN